VLVEFPKKNRKKEKENRRRPHRTAGPFLQTPVTHGLELERRNIENRESFQMRSTLSTALVKPSASIAGSPRI